MEPITRSDSAYASSSVLIASTKTLEPPCLAFPTFAVQLIRPRMGVLRKRFTPCGAFSTVLVAKS